MPPKSTTCPPGERISRVEQRLCPRVPERFSTRVPTATGPSSLIVTCPPTITSTSGIALAYSSIVLLSTWASSTTRSTCLRSSWATRAAVSAGGRMRTSEAMFPNADVEASVSEIRLRKPTLHAPDRGDVPGRGEGLEDPVAQDLDVGRDHRQRALLHQLLEQIELRQLTGSPTATASYLSASMLFQMRRLVASPARARVEEIAAVDEQIGAARSEATRRRRPDGPAHPCGRVSRRARFHPGSCSATECAPPRWWRAGPSWRP